MNNSRKTRGLAIALLCAITLLACDLGGGVSGGQPLAAPSNLRVTSTTKTVAHIAWDDKSNNENGFEIEVERKQNLKTNPNETQWEISGLECAKAYNIRVRAFDGAGNSPWSNQVTAQTLACDSGGQQPPVTFQVTGITLTVTPTSYNGTCPPTRPVQFSGVITVNGPGTVTYAWGGGEGPSAGHNNFVWGPAFSPATGEHSITFSSAGSKTVTLDYPRTIRATGWYEVGVGTSVPNEMGSPVVGLTVTCQ